MRPMGAVALADALAARGLIDSGRTPAPAQIDRPWFVSAVLGGAGWLAGVFVLLFLGALFEPSGATSFAIIGLVLLGAAFGLFHTDRKSAFLDQLALALSIAGQLALVWSAAEATESAAQTAALMAVVQLVLLFALPNPLARTLAAFFASMAWALAIRFAWWDSALWKPEEVAPLPALVGWLVIWVPVGAAVYALVTREAHWMSGAERRIARPALTGGIAALSAAVWASEPFASLPFFDAGRETTSWLALWPLLAAASALFAASCAYRLRSRALVGFAIACALLHVMQFYYVFGATLLTKSAIMLAVGAALLAVAWLLRRRIASRDGAVA